MFEKQNMRKLISSPYLSIGAIVLFTFYVYFFFTHRTAQTSIHEAESTYLMGEQAPSLSERKEAFNRALSVYLNIDESYNPEYGTGRLYYNLGNSFFQLEQYPLAILYYYKALALDPGEEKAEHNLDIAYGKLSMQPPKMEKSVMQLIFLDGVFSLPRRLQLFALFCVVFFGVLSWNLWSPSSLTKISVVMSGIVLAYFSLSVLYTQYAAPVEGVVVRSTALYRDAGSQYAKVMDEPVASGSKVQVLSMDMDKKWAKVETADGKLGFVPIDSLRVI